MNGRWKLSHEKIANIDGWVILLVLSFIFKGWPWICLIFQSICIEGVFYVTSGTFHIDFLWLVVDGTFYWTLVLDNYCRNNASNIFNIEFGNGAGFWGIGGAFWVIVMVGFVTLKPFLFVLIETACVTGLTGVFRSVLLYKLMGFDVEKLIPFD